MNISNSFKKYFTNNSYKPNVPDEYWSDIHYFNDHVEYTEKTSYIDNKAIYYKDKDYLHRFEGPAFIHTYNFLNLDEGTTQKINKEWYINNKIFPNWIPRIEDNLVYGNCNKKIIFDVITKFDREYGVYLNKTYSVMNENKNNLKKDFQQLILSMIQFYKETTITQISNEIMNQIGILLPDEMNKIQTIIEENSYELIINNNIIYDKKRDKISIP